MPERYVIVHRTEVGRPIVEADGVSVVSALDRGFVVDADERQVERLEEEGWRVKAVRDPHTIRLFTYEIDTAGGELPPTPPGFAPVEAADGVNHLIQLVGPLRRAPHRLLDSDDERRDRAAREGDRRGRALREGGPEAGRGAARQRDEQEAIKPGLSMRCSSPQGSIRAGTLSPRRT